MPKAKAPKPPEYRIAEMRAFITRAETDDLRYGCPIRDATVNQIFDHFKTLVAALERGQLLPRESVMKQLKDQPADPPGMGSVSPRKRLAAQDSNGGPDFAVNQSTKKGGARVQPIVKASRTGKAA